MVAMLEEVGAEMDCLGAFLPSGWTGKWQCQQTLSTLFANIPQHHHHYHQHTFEMIEILSKSNFAHF